MFVKQRNYFLNVTFLIKLGVQKTFTTASTHAPNYNLCEKKTYKFINPHVSIFYLFKINNQHSITRAKLTCITFHLNFVL